MSELWVVDSSGLVRMKTVVAGANQWEAFKLLEGLVEAGKLVLCRQVINEVSELMHPDVPGAWAAGMRKKVKHPLDVDYEHVTEVMTKVPNLVDPNETKEIADPYVIAQAMQLATEGHSATVVTHESVDHAPLVCMKTACEQLNVLVCGLAPFLDAVGIPHKKPKSEGGT